MLDEFLLKHLEEIKNERIELSERWEELNQQETDAQNEINRLMEKEDVGLEIFSPRSSGDSVKEQIAHIQTGLEEIHLAMAHVSDQIAENQARKEKYENMLQEARSIEEEKEQIAQKAQADQIINFDKNENTVILAESEEIQMGSESVLKAEESNQKKEPDSDCIVLERRELVDILKRVEKSMNYAHGDRNKCRNELKNLQYYLKALLSQK